jgi:hypothetical protein
MADPPMKTAHAVRRIFSSYAMTVNGPLKTGLLDL